MLAVKFMYGNANETYAPNCMAASIGKTVPLYGPNRESLGDGTLIEAEVSPDGKKIKLMLEVPDDSAYADFYKRQSSPPDEYLAFSFAGEPQPMPEPALVELRADALGEYEERWMIAPPPEGTPYRVVDDSWSEDYSVRTIRAFTTA
jgi:hypothetical protein